MKAINFSIFRNGFSGLILMLILFTMGFSSCGPSANQITEEEFEADLYELFDLVILERRNGDRGLFHNYGLKLDSTSIYYDLTSGFNNQYLLYITREPFLEVKLPEYLIDGDTLPGTRKKIYEAYTSQPWFELYKECVSHYLYGKGVTIRNYKLSDQPSITKKELAGIAAKFFYIHDYNDSTGLTGHACGVINPYYQEDLVINPVVEAFAFQSLVNMMMNDQSILTHFFQVQIPALNEQVAEMDATKDQIIDFSKNAAYAYYENDPAFLTKLVAQYEDRKAGLPFILID